MRVRVSGTDLGRVSDAVPVRTGKVHLPQQNLLKQVLLLVSLTAGQSRRTQMNRLRSARPGARLAQGQARLDEGEKTAPSKWGEATQEDVCDDTRSPDVHFQTIAEEPRADR